MTFIKWFFIVVLDFVFSSATIYLVFDYFKNELEKDSSCGTGSLGAGIMFIAICVVLFIVLLLSYGALFKWVLFSLI